MGAQSTLARALLEEAIKEVRRREAQLGNSDAEREPKQPNQEKPTPADGGEGAGRP